MSSCGWRRSSSFQGRCRGRVQSWWEGRRPTLRALPRTLLMPCIKEVQRSPVLESILAMEVDSTAELPSAPDPGSVGSSSCVSNFARYMSVRSTFVVLTESSNFNTATPHGPSLRDELSGSEGETGESMECVLHRRRRAVCKGAAWAFKFLLVSHFAVRARQRALPQSPRRSRSRRPREALIWSSFPFQCGCILLAARRSGSRSRWRRRSVRRQDRAGPPGP